ncbi:hypothetical protein [Hydrogenivirga sp. 128-5-R1-1]|uniref:hypothetical protein n=1 Tax=Hydrogenivirga sp. 128-5-R1-1 TaxID=392423 RepID=UPI00015F073E|nr:hypothetical protein [Hydrogenivirga sp. 128-5-R1-1]EDP73873.1 hypothetical protein HG1285_01448 [Hydrogenivirga sp. 128-5-R1-1]
MINSILYTLEIIFLISLIFASISSIKTWLLSKKLTKNIKKAIYESYPLNIPPIKYKNLNQFLISMINKAENSEPIENNLQNLQKEFNIPKNKVEEIKKIIIEYTKNIYFWNKYGKISGYIALITGGLSFIIFYVIK